jgi:hypothetical protein
MTTKLAFNQTQGNVLNVKDYGAVGDGITDDTAAFQAAVDAAQLADPGLYRYKEVFIPSTANGYKITGVNGGNRVRIRGESMWGTRIIVSGVGEYGFASFQEVSDLWIDGVAIQNGATRIDEASWTRADRGNTGIIIGAVDGLSYTIGAHVTNCRISNLANGIHRDSSSNSVVDKCYIQDCWHGIFNRADISSPRELNINRDTNCYIRSCSGIGIGFSSQGVQGIKGYDFSGTVIETCCTDAAHDGINGFFDSGGANIKTPFANNVYMEASGGSAIGIRSTVMQLHGFYFQGLHTPIKSATTGSFWIFEAGEFVSTGGPYDIDMTGHLSGRNHFQQIAFSAGLNPAAIPFTTVKDCSASGILPDGNSNTYMDDTTVEINKQSGTPLTLNRRATDGTVLDLQRQGTSRNTITATSTYTAFTSPIRMPEYTVVTVPSASAYQGALIAVSDETGGYTMAFSDGTNWRRVQDRAVVS